MSGDTFEYMMTDTHTENIPEPTEKKVPPKGWEAAIKSFKEGLIDTSKRNRLIHSPIGKDRGKHLDIIDERSDEVFRLLYIEKKKMQFQSSSDGYDGADGMENIFVPDPPPPSDRHLDLKLQTRLTKDALHKRLLRIYRDSNTAVEEQGANPLFLALGFVCWFESTSSQEERFAPLIVLPVELHRQDVKDNFRLVLRDQDIEPNHSFDAYLQSDFDLKLPRLPDEENWLPSTYFQQVNDLISRRENWSVRPDTIQLGFFSSGKFLMSKDLDEADPESDLMRSLLFDGFGGAPALFDSQENLDERYVDPRSLGHIMEADASQAQVIAAAHDGNNMVVQGPPGTGKSQTIANIIAVAVREGRKVLFVAEKRAALDVVYHRLESCHLGPLCLEMHSTKAQKKAVYKDLEQALDLGRPEDVDLNQYEQLKNVRDQLNNLSKQLHTVDEVNGETPYKTMGELTRLIAMDDFPRPDYRVEEMAIWDQDRTEKAAGQVDRLADLTAEHGPEGAHIWRGANQQITPMERQRLNDQVSRLNQVLGELSDCLETACRALSLSERGGLDFLDKVLKLLQLMSAKPVKADRLIRKNAVMEHSRQLYTLLESIQAEQEARKKLSQSMDKSAFDRDWSSERRQIAKYKKHGFWGWLTSSSYRKACRQLKSVLITDLPKNKRLELLDELVRHVSHVREIEEQRTLGERALGAVWRGWKTDLEGILESVRWLHTHIELRGSPEALKAQVDQWPVDVNPDEIAAELQRSTQSFEKVWKEAAQTCDLDIEHAFGEKSIRGVPLTTIMDRMSAWQANPEAQNAWIQLYNAAKAVNQLGLSEIRTQLGSGQLAPEHANDIFTYLRAEAVYDRFTQMNPNLNRIDGKERSSLVEEFKNLDESLLHLSAQEVLTKHYGSIPEGIRGEMGILRGEVKKKTRHMPLRKLMKKCGKAVQDIKPVFLMSPLSVAQYLDVNGLKFDLLLIDEASQVRPADAIGAVMRAKQAIIVGDQKQLPPTSFFDKLVNIEEESEEDVTIEEEIAKQSKDYESILAMCEARKMPQCMLQWHYRSQHESLIAVSNKEFYENRLVCPPSPAASSTGFGLSFEPVDGIYRRGKGRGDNPVEAKAVMNAVLQHAKARPGETLGVVAMSQAQQNTIQNEAERMRAEYPELNAFCSETKEEPFFVKNLETVQGDERDVIFISIGYGKTEDGRFFQNFGPVSREGGERRLNVLFTRAKKRCRVFASIRHTDIQHAKSRHIGPYLLKTFLKYAETGEMDVPTVTGKEPDSPFEEAVGAAISKHGYKIDYQVGSSGFLIDLAVRNPDSEGDYVLAIECDGATYHSSKWARERDRMRQKLLEGKGWTFHRIWSTDWFNNPKTETKRAVDAIQCACVKKKVSSPAQSIRRPPIRRRKKSNKKAQKIATKYKEFDANLTDFLIYGDLSEARDKAVAKLISEIVVVEGPVHEEVVLRRLRTLGAYSRTGRQIMEKIDSAIRFALRKKWIQQCDTAPGFFINPGVIVQIRERGSLDDSLLRKPEMIHPLEYRAAILAAVRRNISIDRDECAVDVARIFGFKSTRSKLKEEVLKQINFLVRDKVLICEPDDTVRIGEA